MLCFPFIFRGALDVSATTINEAMKIAAVEAIAGLARVEASEVVAAAYGGAAPVFGPDYIIPKPFDPRLILEDRPRRRARRDGQRRRPPPDRRFRRLPPRPGTLRVPLRPTHAPGVRGGEAGAERRIVFAEGEDERMLRAAQTLVDDGIAAPDPARPARRDRRARCATWACASTSADGVHVLDPAQDHDVFGPLIPEYQRLAGRRGAPPEVGGAARRARAPRSPPRCCCTPARPMRRSAAAPATGGGRSSTSCRSSRAGRT